MVFTIIEILLYLIINYLRKDFQWLITHKDEKPTLDSEGLNSFFAKSHDPVLGWTRRPNTQGVEEGKFGKVSYHIDELGSRTNTKYNNHNPTIACFGDSYTFCRQVEDSETWEYYLSEILQTCVLNFGVGNYGIDQALLRYEHTNLPSSIKTVIMAVVPETICRIQSTWKHYLEFGNTFGFKPRYVLKNKSKLRLITNPMQNREDFNNYDNKLKKIIDIDRFYLDKFRKYQFRFPFSFSFLRNFDRNINLISRLLKRKIYRVLGISSPEVEDAPFKYIMNDNIKISHSLYHDKKSVELFTSIINKFINLAKKRNHKMYVVILPQLIDLKTLEIKNGRTYSDVLSSFAIPEGTLYDFTPYFTEIKDVESFYVNDKYGGHISNLGNKYVAEKLSELISQ